MYRQVFWEIKATLSAVVVLAPISAPPVSTSHFPLPAPLRLSPANPLTLLSLSGSKTFGFEDWVTEQNLDFGCSLQTDLYSVSGPSCLQLSESNTVSFLLSVPKIQTCHQRPTKAHLVLLCCVRQLLRCQVCIFTPSTELFICLEKARHQSS